MMKRTAILCAAAFAAFEAFGIGATQEWVRRHVVDALTGVVRSSKAANIEVAAEIPASAFSGADTNDTISCTIRAGVGAHAALKVVASSVPEIPAGTFYALDGDGNYVNCSNALIRTIYAVPYTVNQVSTNAFGGVSTNAVRMGNFWATDATNGVWRMGIDGDTILYSAGNRSAYFAIRSTTLPERAAAALIPPRTARLSIRDMLSLVMPTACARTSGETVYTVTSESTVAITTITFTRTNRFGKTTTITFTPDGLEGVYSGPSGPFATKAEAEAAAADLANWDFGDWLYIVDSGVRIEMSREDFRNSDVWRQLLSAIGTDRTETEVPVPGMPAHPCPAPDDFYVFDQSIWNNPNITDEEAISSVWKVNEKYSDGHGGYDREKIDQWRGQNDCKCGVVGCENNGVSQHRPGRVKIHNGEEIYSDDVDGGDGCKCCIRCVKYGSDYEKTIIEYNDHRASGEGSGFCGCACGVYGADNENEWPQDFHNLPAHTLAWPRLDFSCMCYCAKAKALNGEYVRHAKYAGDSPWCDEICARCGMVEEEVRYINHSYPAFDTRHVTLREAEWKDHTPRAEAEAGVSILNDPDYYRRCGCACGAYDTKNGGVLPAAFGKFHQFHNTAATCLCTCGQIHSKDSLGEGNGAHDPNPCPDICAVCLKVEDKTAQQSIVIDGASYPKLVMRLADQPGDHTPSATACGCRCGDITSTTTFENSADTIRFHSARNPAKECTCACGKFHDPDPETHECGSHMWIRCKICSEFVLGEEGHSFPGTSYDENGHSCECGDMTEPHGELVAEGEKEATFSHGHEDGWVQMMVCPKGCGYKRQLVHKHHFVNCGICDAGDYCEAVCTGCNGAHVFGEPTATKCAHCECEMSEECKVTPEDITKHAGWEPCGEDAEDDNDWIEAKGGHCRCECRRFGHLARTDHDYQLTAGLARYEQCTGEDRETKHYYRLGTCTRCGQHKKQKQAHDFPDEPTEYRYKSDEICRWAYLCQCKGCDYIKYEDSHGHTLKDTPSVCENVSATVCRWKYECKNCHGLIKDDTHGHERDPANGCRCKNGCGYQYEHNYVTDACGNESCSYCKAGKNGVVENHSGYTDAGDVHRCACGRDEQPHSFSGWTLAGVDPGTLHYVRSCVCGRTDTKDEACVHSFGAWREIGRGGGKVTYMRTCETCAFAQFNELPDSGGACDTNLNLHVAAEGVCGCQCGRYGPDGEASPDIRLHSWEETENADGVLPCLCKCGRYHVKRAASTSLVQRGRVCGEICAYCREKSGTGLDVGRADDTLHTPCEASDGHCGCKCGKLTAAGTNIAKFHIRKPGSCRCLGTDGSGGDWHFRMVKAAGCHKICACDTEFGGEHLAASSEKVQATPQLATAADHTKRSSSSCGCECGQYYSGNWSDWIGVANHLHNTNPNACGCFCGHAREGQVSPYHKKLRETDCECACGQEVLSHVWSSGKCKCNCLYHDKQHKNIHSGKCTGVCHGECGAASDPSNKSKHTPHATLCGCECQAFKGPDYPDSEAFHKVADGDCGCKCEETHKGFTAKSGCPLVCAKCGRNRDRTESGISIHSFGDACVCGCGDYTRAHDWNDFARQTPRESYYECPTCMNEISVYRWEATCKRSQCNEIRTRHSEEGHDANLHSHDPPAGLNYCDIHAIYYEGESCPLCKDEEKDSGGGSGAGGESGGGDIDDIVNGG